MAEGVCEIQKLLYHGIFHFNINIYCDLVHVLKMFIDEITRLKWLLVLIRQIKHLTNKKKGTLSSHAY